MKSQKLQNLLSRVNADNGKIQQNEELTILSNETTNAIKGGKNAPDPCGTKCKPNSACNGNN
jgi:hypothetical protein